MKICQLQQGSPEWLAHRAQHYNASDAPAMLGCSPYSTRAELLHRLHTGISADVNAATQRIFDAGHQFEALARPLAEAIIGEELYPVTGTSGKYSASFDGLTTLNDVSWEHKSLNAELRAALIQIKAEIDAGGDPAECVRRILPLMYRVQMEHQDKVAEPAKTLFTASKWEGETLVEALHCWYFPDPELRAQIVAGWEQFEKDLAAYVPPAPVEAKPVGRAPETLPALHIEVTGMVKASNLDAFKAHAAAAFKQINRELKTDADFADAEKTVKWCADVESRLAAAKENALGQTASIDALFKVIDEVSEEARKTRLELDKLVTKRKAELKDAIVLKARVTYTDHVAALEAEIKTVRLSMVPAPDFALAAKNKRTLDSLNAAVDQALADGKIAADSAARSVREKLAWCKENAEGYGFLFSDLQSLIAKPMDDFQLTVITRVASHKQAEADKAEALRAEIAQQEKVKAEAEASAAAATAAALAAAAAPPPAPAQTAPAPARASKSTAMLKLGEIGNRLGFPLTADVLAGFGFLPAATDKSAKLYLESDFPKICHALIERITAAAEGVTA